MSGLKLPIIDARELSGPTRDATTQTMMDSLMRWGFVGISGHNVDEALLQAAYRSSKAFFAQSNHEKSLWECPEIGRQRGYTGFGVERAKDQSVGDLKEFFHLGPQPFARDPAFCDGITARDAYPNKPEDFIPSLTALYQALDAVAVVLLEAIGRHVGIDPNDLVGCTRRGATVLRTIHYPPLRDSDPPDAVRSAAHEDINLITLLPASTEPGLELCDRDGTWRAIEVPPGVIIADTGDLMAYWTNGLLPATTHRVVNPPQSHNVERYSLPFFVHPAPGWMIRPISGDNPPKAAGELLRERLIENGVLKGYTLFGF